jgi:hypothetical protein
MKGGQEQHACMTAGSQTLTGADSMRVALLSAKTHLKVGFWNVRTMFGTSKLAQVTKEMRAYGLHILGVSESRWTGFGTTRTREGETVLHSGRDDNKHYGGVALILRKGVEKTLIDWKPIDERMMRARFRGKHGKMTILQCYAPTNDADEEVKERFYSTLLREKEATPQHDILIIMGDLNAKTGANNDGYEQVMGKHGCGEMNDNGERLANFCSTNSLVIGGTLFPHKTIHKLTWESPNNRDKNQIDHIMINTKWRGSLQDVKVRRGADVGSDHHLVTAKVKIKLRRTGPPTKNTRKFEVASLRDPEMRHKYNISVKNRFEGLDQENGSIEEMWHTLADTYQASAKEVLGYRRRTDKEWLSQETWQAIEDRKKQKAKINECRSERLKAQQKQKYTEANTKVKRFARRDKRRHIEDLATQAEEAARRRELSTVYQITRRLCNQKPTTSGPVRDKQGKLLTNEKDKEQRWKEHFEEVLNRPEPTTMADIKDPTSELNINTDPPTQEEIESAVKTLKNGKSPGDDQLNPELFKADPHTAAQALYPLFKAVWEEEDLPLEWRKGTIIQVPKKGNLSDCNNWRGITLLSIPSKILCSIIVQRVAPALDRVLRKEQAGFRKGRGCTEQIFTLRNILEQSAEWQRQVYIMFVDYEKAFDSLHRDSLWRILRAYGIPSKIINIIKQFYHHFHCSVGKSDLTFEVKSGVRQGCVLSGLLFITAIDWVLSKATEDSRRGIRWTPFSQIEDLDYADDLALMSHTERQIQEKTERVGRFGQQVGLKINAKKTKLMTVNIDREVKTTVSGEDIETVKRFSYLGSVITENGGAEEDILQRLSKARGAFARMGPVWRSRQYSRRTKIRLYEACVLSVLLYGAECWRLTKSDSQKLGAFHTSCLRKICRIFWPQKISNKDLLTLTRQNDIVKTITERRWKFVGHTLRRDSDHLARVALRWTPEGRRRRGRPRTTWRRTFEAEAQSYGKTWKDLERLATNRGDWSSFVAALCASDGREEDR